MTSFKDFFNSKTKNPGEPSGSTAIAAVSSAVAKGLTSTSDVLTVSTGTIAWSNSEKEKFAHQVELGLRVDAAIAGPIWFAGLLRAAVAQ